MLIGLDLQKDPATILAAYNDSQGITAQFNLNLLTRINNELGGNFDLSQFSHRAVYDHEHHRIVISIVSLTDQQVVVADHPFDFVEGEEILTEYSHKYTVEGFAEQASQYGFRLHSHWTDDQNLFGLLHLVHGAGVLLRGGREGESSA